MTEPCPMTPERLAEIQMLKKRAQEIIDVGTGDVRWDLVAALCDDIDAQAAEIGQLKKVQTACSDHIGGLLIRAEAAESQLTRYKAAMVKIREEASGSSPDGTAIWQWANAALEDGTDV